MSSQVEDMQQQKRKHETFNDTKTQFNCQCPPSANCTCAGHTQHCHWQPVATLTVTMR